MTCWFNAAYFVKTETSSFNDAFVCFVLTAQECGMQFDLYSSIHKTNWTCCRSTFIHNGAPFHN